VTSSPQTWLLDIPYVIKTCGYTEVKYFPRVSGVPDIEVIKKELKELIPKRINEFLDEWWYTRDKKRRINVWVYIKVLS